MAMADLAKINANQPTSLSEISLRQGISISFLEQIFLRLKKNNLVLIINFVLYMKLLKESKNLFV